MAGPGKGGVLTGSRALPAFQAWHLPPPPTTRAGPRTARSLGPRDHPRLAVLGGCRALGAGPTPPARKQRQRRLSCSRSPAPSHPALAGRCLGWLVFF